MATPRFPAAVGVWWTSDAVPIAQAQQTAAELEKLGYGSLWYGEAGGKEALTQASALLSATTRLLIGTGIANIHARDAVAAEGGGRTLTALHPDRFMLGLGVSHRPLVEQRSGTYTRPVATMREYLANMDALPATIEPDSGRPTRLLAALGPRMLALAGTEADGAHTYLVTPEHTAQARNALGPDQLLVVEQGVIATTDRETALRRAHAHLGPYSQLPNYRNNWRRLGFSEEDLVPGGSTRLAEALIAWGRAEDLAARVHAHFVAGADHVVVQALGESASADPMPTLRSISPALTALDSTAAGR